MRIYCRPRLLFSVISMAVLHGCGDSTGPEIADTVIVSTVEGDTLPSVVLGDEVQLVARAFQGNTRIRGLSFRWHAEDRTVATVDTAGLLHGVGYGHTNITATVVGQSAVVGQTVVDVVPAPVAALEIELPGGFIDPGHTLQMRPIAFDSAGELIQEPLLSYSSVSSEVSVDSAGNVTGVHPGQAVINAVSWNGVEAEAVVRVTPVTGLYPDSVYYGASIAITGQDLPTDARIFFSGENDQPVEAFVQKAMDDRYEVWVPAYATTGPITFVAPQDSFSTSRGPVLIGDQDVYEAAGSSDPAIAMEIPFPFHNPSLLVRRNAIYYFVFRVTEPTPFSWHLASRTEDTRSTAVGYFVRMNMTHEGLAFANVYSELVTYDFIGNSQLDSVAYSRESLEPGWYLLMVGQIPLHAGSPPAVSYPYGLTLTDQPHFELPPDDYEPNDTPREAPTITLPFQVSDLHLENPYAIDYYVFEVSGFTLLDIAVTTERSEPLLAVLQGNDADLFLSPQSVRAATWTAGQSTAAMQHGVHRGTYTIMVWEYGGRSSEYSLSVTSGSAQEGVVPYTAVAPGPRPGDATIAALRTRLRLPAQPLRVVPAPGAWR